MVDLPAFVASINLHDNSSHPSNLLFLSTPTVVISYCLVTGVYACGPSPMEHCQKMATGWLLMLFSDTELLMRAVEGD